MTNNSNELHKLVIRNLAILEAAPKVVEDIERSVFAAINSRIRNWYESRKWEGIATFNGVDGETSIYPSGWPKDEDGKYQAGYSFEPTNDVDYTHYLSALTGMASSDNFFPYEFGLWFYVDQRAITGQPNKVWKKYLADQFDLYPELKLGGFNIFSGDRGLLYCPVQINAEILAQSYPEVDEALAPLDQALKSLADLHVVFDKIVKNAVMKFRADTSS